MSQTGPHPGPSPQPAPGQTEGRYALPADPWIGQDGWTGRPDASYDPGYAHSWEQPTPPRRRGPGPLIITLVSVLGVLVVAGLSVTTYLVTRGERADGAQKATATPSAAQPSTVAQDAADARFVAAGQCVRNDGSEDVPQMRVTACRKGTFEVLKRIDGATTGEKDAQIKCAAVTGYTNWFFYDSELDGLDFVLCLRGL
jgi:hypothetical protein